MSNRKSLAFLCALLMAADTAAAQGALDQLKAYKDGTATPVEAAKQSLAAGQATAQKYDILGIKLGMPLQAALAALKTHSPNFRLTPQSLKYDVVPNPVTYGIWATTPNVYTGTDPTIDKVYKGVTSTDRLPPDSEQFYFALAMAPNPPMLTKVTRLVRWSANTAPVQDTLVADLLQKFGTPSSDTGAKALAADVNTTGGRAMVWVDDASGNRLTGKDWTQCTQATNSPFSFPPVSGGLGSISVDAGNIKNRIERGYTEGVGYYADLCSKLTVIQANLYDTRLLRYPPTPNVVGGLLMSISSGPLERSTADATHDLLVQGARNREQKQTDAAKQNRPKL